MSGRRQARKKPGSRNIATDTLDGTSIMPDSHEVALLSSQSDKEYSTIQDMVEVSSARYQEKIPFVIGDFETDATQKAFKTINDYYEGSVESDTWIISGANKYWFSSKGSDGLWKTQEDMRNQFITSARMFREQNVHEGGRLLNSAFDSLSKILQAEHPNTLEYFLRAVEKFEQFGFPEVVAAIAKQFSCISSIVLGHHHPLSIIFTWVVKRNARHLDTIPTQIWEVLLQAVERLTGSLSRDTLKLRGAYIYNVLRQQSPHSAVVSQRLLLEECEAELGPLDQRTLRTHIDLCWRLKDDEDYEEQERLSRKGLKHAAELQSCDNEYYRAFFLKSLAFAVVSRDREEGVSLLREAIALSTCIWGRDDAKVIQMLSDLKKWHTA